MLDIDTFDQISGGNVLYKALTHPLAAERIADLAARVGGAPLAVFDPAGFAPALFALNPAMRKPVATYVRDVERVGPGHLPVTELPASGAATLLIAAFDAERIAASIAHLVPASMRVLTLDEIRLPDAMLTDRRAYLNRLNFATNHAFFRERDGLSTRLTSANYFANYGAGAVRLWLRLFDQAGQPLATWEQALPAGPGGFVLDSRDIRERLKLPPFLGQLFIHAIGAAGHDVIKYALDTFGTDGDPTLSVTHDANAWPSDRYAGLPAPAEDETVTLWIQNSHAAAIPAGAILLDRMGAEVPVPVADEVPPYATRAVDVGAAMPGLRWPAQIELRTGRHVVRPRYEIRRGGRSRIAHVNVERADLRPDAAIRSLSNLFGRGYLLPFPVLPPARFRTIVQPTPMALSQADLPIRLDVFDTGGRRVAEHFLGRLPRDHDLALDLAPFAAEAGHAELVYDFRDGGGADGWLHGLFRYEDRQSGHAAETSFGAHIFNTAMVFRDEPQSYGGPPPGLSTRLFLKLGDELRRSFAVLIYPASAAWRAQSSTVLQLIDGAGLVVAESALAIACSGSAMVWPDALFGDVAIGRAGPGGYVSVRDTTCRLFGYHGLMDAQGGFSLDHMFGF